MKNAILIVAIAICAVIFAFSASELYNYYHANSVSEKEFAELLPSDDELIADAEQNGNGDGLSYDNLLPYYKRLRDQNSDMVGWLRIPDTRVSYPVMQSPASVDPEFYLHKNFKKEYSTNGTLFASSISNVTLPSDVVTIYGHRMKTGAMFGSFGDFLKKDFLQEHQTVIFDTFKERSEYKIFSIFSLAVGTDDPNEFHYYDYNTFYGQQDLDEFISRVRGHESTEIPENAPALGDKILLLSTCEYTHENGRLVIVAVRVNP